MKRGTALQCAALLLMFDLAASSAQASGAPPSFTLSATNETISADGGTIPFTLTSVNGFTGSVIVTCIEPAPVAGVILPWLNVGGPARPPFMLTANGTATGNFSFLASPPSVLPVKLNIPRRRKVPLLSLAGVFLLGFALRKKTAVRWTRLSLAVALMVSLTGISGCGGPEHLTPGSYTYTLTATEQGNPLVTVSTTAVLTVPPGIVTHQPKH